LHGNRIMHFRVASKVTAFPGVSALDEKSMAIMSAEAGRIFFANFLLSQPELKQIRRSV